MSGGKKNTVSKLRHRLTLQEEVRSLDGAGGYSSSWQNIADLWAEITSISSKSIYGKEKLFAGKLQSEISHKVLIRYRSPVSTDMRLVFAGRIFNIRAIMNIDEHNEILELLVEEGVA